MEAEELNKIKDILDNTAMGLVPVVIDETDLTYLEPTAFIPKKRLVYTIWTK